MKFSTTNLLVAVIVLVTSSFHCCLQVNAFQTRPGLPKSNSIQIGNKPSCSYCDNRKQKSSWLLSERNSITPTSSNRLYATPPDNGNSDYQQSNDDSNPVVSITPSSSIIASLAMIGIPFMSVVFPWLLQTARALPANSSQQLVVITALFVGNRVYLYGMATIIIVLAAIRGSSDSLSLGKRVTDLTEELLYRPDLSTATTTTKTTRRGEETENEEQQITTVTTTTTTEATTPKLIQNLKQSGFEESLDGVSSETQALVLPLLVSFLLASSIFFLPFWNGQADGGGAGGARLFQNSILQDLLKEYLPLITQIWNAGILTVFCKAELRRLGFEIFSIGTTTPSGGDDDEESASIPSNMGATIEWGLAVAITAIACFTPLWQAQNFVNMSLAILVSRMIQLDRFPAIVGALTLLTLYDVTSVFLIPAAGATAEMMMSTTTGVAPVMQDAATAAASSLDVHGSAIIGSGSSDMLISAAGAADSAMGSVAIQKLTSGTFQPGLLVTKIDPKTNLLGGALGLGDAVFPSILATFVRRFDLFKKESDGGQQERFGLFPVAIGGYLLGCTACEFVPAISTSGLPALALIIPFMLGSVVAGATITGQLGQLWNYNPKEEEVSR